MCKTIVRVSPPYWGGSRDMSLAEALTPEPVIRSDDQITELQDRVRQQSEVIGSLVALLVEKGILNLNEAAKVCDIHGQLDIQLI